MPHWTSVNAASPTVCVLVQLVNRDRMSSLTRFAPRSSLRIMKVLRDCMASWAASSVSSIPMPTTPAVAVAELVVCSVTVKVPVPSVLVPAVMSMGSQRGNW